jgi:hypothetical protein
MKSNPDPDESAALLRFAVAAELEAAKMEAVAFEKLKEAESYHIAASNGDIYEATAEAGQRFIDAEQTHFTTRRAHQAAIDRVSGAQAWMECHAREADCPWIGA